MRRVIDTAPKDGTFVILEDDVGGSFESAHWSADGRGWIKKNGEPSEITATHWLTMHLPEEGDEFILQDELIPPKETGSIAPPGVARAPLLLFPLGPGRTREGDGINSSGYERGPGHWRPG